MKKLINKITKQHFRVDNFDGLKAFYVDILGMKNFSTIDTMIFGFNKESCTICFHKKQSMPYISTPNDFYWKIGITLKNLDLAVEHLHKKNIVVSSPVQFKDIGYMAKITDPKGFIIELLQQGFLGYEEKIDNNIHPIGPQGIFAHITLRIHDLQKSTYYFEKILKMRLMSIQAVKEYGFCLYFYSFSNERLPNEDLHAVKNRQWLWRRPYTFIELQHIQTPSVALNKQPFDMASFDGFSYGGSSHKYISYATLMNEIL
ncbi:MAG: VOC family protein [Psychromonas sp.]|nr:VOC family protein [Psychromonas sp.]